jgi:hypothetical protein
MGCWDNTGLLFATPVWPSPVEMMMGQGLTSLLRSPGRERCDTLMR